MRKIRAITLDQIASYYIASNVVLSRGCLPIILVKEKKIEGSF